MDRREGVRTSSTALFNLYKGVGDALVGLARPAKEKLVVHEWGIGEHGVSAHHLAHRLLKAGVDFEYHAKDVDRHAVESAENFGTKQSFADPGKFPLAIRKGWIIDVSRDEAGSKLAADLEALSRLLKTRPRALKSRMRFENGDMLAPEAGRPGERPHVVVCGNTLGWMGDEAGHAAFMNLASSLRVGGHLVVDYLPAGMRYAKAVRLTFNEGRHVMMHDFGRSVFESWRGFSNGKFLDKRGRQRTVKSLVDSIADLKAYGLEYTGYVPNSRFVVLRKTRDVDFLAPRRVKQGRV
jgi:hypothetical protein